MQVTWPKFHKPRFGESAWSIRVLNTLLALTALAWVLVLIPEEPVLDTVIPLTDATVVERSGEQAMLRVSHPTQEQLCSISRDEFDGGLPEVGAVIPVDYNGTTCALPPWSDTTPSPAMRIAAVLGTLILVGWTFRAVTRPPAPAPQKRARTTDPSRAKARRRRKRRLRR